MYFLRGLHYFKKKIRFNFNFNFFCMLSKKFILFGLEWEHDLSLGLVSISISFVCLQNI
jgi:hypothetical protein